MHREFYTVKIGNFTFEVDKRYQNLKVIGNGSYGIVCSADDVIAHRQVAIKKVKDLFQDSVDAKRMLREIKMLKYFGCHENIISLYDLVAMPYGEQNFSDLYIITQLYDCDLERIISSNQPLSECHIQYFLFQILKALKFLHSANVLHRDLKPSNILVKSNCDLAICDFGLARGIENAFIDMTEYVVTRWYRAPELLCENSTYGWEVDIWSVGCIFAELLGRKPLLPGRNQMNQLKLVIKLLGPQRGDSLRCIQKQSARNVVEKLNYGPPTSFRELFPEASENAIDLLSRMLVFDASKRISVDDALCHPFLAALTRAHPQFLVTKPLVFRFEHQ
ncbi:uncharacterized protein [Blastocystis hominis]|uniref:Mitogen-activated protein kinase n=1 Tax=Blastocystis hominis TaxID=12968 RepID=D8LYT1_BLAHO|nr:uncharacterized protein [Blastocystis hominis]CBK20736.2 unnamed protein product [Blastocystis hominis]|eukprot:XP_012894784.1 uncharacterized protein [Blastocystis hominis]